MDARRYTSLAISFHWLVAIGVIGNVALAWIWPLVADEGVRPLIDLHKSIGITVLGLAIMRLIWRLTHRPPPLPSAYQQWEIRLSHLTHVLLYVLIFAMPITGWLHDSAWKDAATHPMSLYGIVPWPRLGFITAIEPIEKERLHDVFGEAHEIAAKFVYVLVGLHILGALKHQFMDGTRELQRMWYTGTPE